MRPTAYSPGIDQRYLYQNTNAIGIAYFFLNCTCKFSRKLVVS